MALLLPLLDAVLRRHSGTAVASHTFKVPQSCLHLLEPNTCVRTALSALGLRVLGHLLAHPPAGQVVRRGGAKQGEAAESKVFETK